MILRAPRIVRSDESILGGWKRFWVALRVDCCHEAQELDFPATAETKSGGVPALNLPKFSREAALCESPARKCRVKWRNSDSPVGTTRALTQALRLCSLVHVHGAPGFVGGVAEIFEGALGALWLARDAEFPPMPDDLMRKQDPLVLRDHLHQVLLNLLRIILRS